MTALVYLYVNVIQLDVNVNLGGRPHASDFAEISEYRTPEIGLGLKQSGVNPPLAM
jgi:hypothetical protein